MAAVDINIARQVAIDRIIQVMQVRYAEELAAIKDDDLFLPPPVREAYYYYPEDPDAILVNRDPFVMVYSTQPRTLIPGTMASSGVTGRSEYRKLVLSVTLIFQAAPPKPIIRNGKQLTMGEVHMLRAERYTGAMAKTIQKYACDFGAVSKLELINDTPDLFFQTEQKVKGIATTQWSIDQKILMPNRAPLT